MLFFHWLSLVPLALIRSIVWLLGKQPGAIAGEFAAAFSTAFGASHIGEARTALARTKSVGWGAIAPLRIPLAEVRRARALRREANLMRTRGERKELNFFSGGGAWVILGMVVVSVGLFVPLLDAGRLAGGSLLPLSDTVGDLWQNVGYGWRDIGLGFVGAADPFASVLAILGSLTFWQPSFVLVLLWFAALPLAALGAWFCATRITESAGLRAVFAIIWALAPMLLDALQTGRPAALLAHLLLPWLIFAAFAATTLVDRFGHHVAAGRGDCCLRAVSGSGSGRHLADLGLHQRAQHRTRHHDPDPDARLVRALGLAADDARLVAVDLRRPGRARSRASRSRVATRARASGWHARRMACDHGCPRLARDAAGHPGAGAVGTAGDPCASRAVPARHCSCHAQPRRGVPRLRHGGRGRARDGRRGRVAIRAHLARLRLEPLLARADRSRRHGLVRPRPLCDRPGLGRGCRARRGGRAPRGGRSARDVGGEGRFGIHIAAYVTAEAGSHPRVGTLRLVPQPDGGLAAQVVHGTGETLDDQSTLGNTTHELTADTRRLATLAGNLASSSGLDPSADLKRFGIGFVLLAPAATTADHGVQPAATSTTTRSATALDGNPRLAAVGTTEYGQLWSVKASTAGIPIPADAGGWFRPLYLSVLGVVFALVLLLSIPTGRAERGVLRRPSAAQIGAVSTRADEDEPDGDENVGDPAGGDPAGGDVPDNDVPDNDVTDSDRPESDPARSDVPDSRESDDAEMIENPGPGGEATDSQAAASVDVARGDAKGAGHAQ